MSHIPVQYKNNKLRAVVVIENTDDNKECVEEMICQLLNIDKTKGCVTFGPCQSVEEASAYNDGYQAGVATSQNITLIECSDLVVDGKIIIQGSKK